MWLTSDLVSNVTQYHFCCILFTRGQPLRPAHAWAEYLCGYLLKHSGMKPSNTYALRTSEGAVGSRKVKGHWADPSRGCTLGERVCSRVSGQVNWVEKIQMVHSFSNLVNTSAHTRVVRRELVPLQNYTYCSGALMLKSFWQLYNALIELPGNRRIASCYRKIVGGELQKWHIRKNATYSQAFEMSDFWAPIYLTYITGLQIVNNSYLAIFHNKNTFLCAILAQ